MGAFRQVGRVVFWPAVLSARLLFAGGGLFSYLSLIAVILSYGAVITSLGLALATWVSRLGRAVALCVTAYVGFSIGWTILFALTVRSGPAGTGLIMGCPAIGTFFATAWSGTVSSAPRKRAGIPAHARRLDVGRFRGGGGAVRPDGLELRPAYGADARIRRRPEPPGAGAFPD